MICWKYFYELAIIVAFSIHQVLFIELRWFFLVRYFSVYDSRALSATLFFVSFRNTFYDSQHAIKQHQTINLCYVFLRIGVRIGLLISIRIYMNQSTWICQFCRYGLLVKSSFINEEIVSSCMWLRKMRPKRKQRSRRRKGKRERMLPLTRMRSGISNRSGMRWSR